MRRSTPSAFGIGEDILQRPQPQSGPVRDREAPGRQKRADLSDRCGDGGAVHPVQLGQRSVRQPQPQMHQRDQQSVDEDQALLGPAQLPERSQHMA
jgi:hypothetical protein